jgi:hypothetical protein
MYSELLLFSEHQYGFRNVSTTVAVKQSEKKYHTLRTCYDLWKVIDWFIHNM